MYWIIYLLNVDNVHIEEKKVFIYSKRRFFNNFCVLGDYFINSFLPFYYQGLSFSDSFFEAVSGLTTTGSTVLQNIESYPDYLLLYRQLLQWAGGVGLVIVVLAIIPAVSGGMKVLQAETSGFADKSFSPRLRETARSLLGSICFLL